MKSKKEMLQDVEDHVWFEGEDYFSTHQREYDDIVDDLENRFRLGKLEDHFIDHGDEVTNLRGHDINVNLLFSAIVTTAVDQAVYKDHPGRSVKSVFFENMCCQGSWALFDTLGFDVDHK